MLPFRNNNKVQKLYTMRKTDDNKESIKTSSINKINFNSIEAPKEKQSILINDSIIKQSRENNKLQITEKTDNEYPLLTDNVELPSIYPIDHLLTDYNTLINSKSKVQLVFYTINVIHQKPFLKFLLHKKSDKFYFPILPTKNNVEKSISTFFKNNLNYKECKYTIKGGIKSNNSVNIIIEYSNPSTSVVKLSKNSLLWWALPYEIMNTQTICNFDIDESVYKFFSSNQKLLYLYSDITNKTKFETPIVLYYGDHEDKIKYYSIFGIDKKDSSSLLGSFYYFSDYKTSVKNAGWNSNPLLSHETNPDIIINKDGKHNKGAILRTIVFLGNSTVYIINKKSEEIKNEATWFKSNSSIFIGPNKDIDMEFVIKNYEQHSPLSSHNFDISKFPEKWDENKADYYIL